MLYRRGNGGPEATGFPGSSMPGCVHEMLLPKGRIKAPAPRALWGLLIQSDTA